MILRIFQDQYSEKIFYGATRSPSKHHDAKVQTVIFFYFYCDLYHNFDNDNSGSSPAQTRKCMMK